MYCSGQRRSVRMRMCWSMFAARVSQSAQLKAALPLRMASTFSADTALLLQPHGFEGFPNAQKTARTDQPPVSKPECVGPAKLKRSVRRRASAFQGRDGNNILIALGDHLVELQPNLAERAEHVLSPLAQAIGPDVGLIRDCRVDVLRPVVSGDELRDLTGVQRVCQSPQPPHVLLRHSLLPQPPGSAGV